MDLVYTINTNQSRNAIIHLMSSTLNYLVLCEEVKVGKDGKLSLINTFDKISPPTIPAMQSKFSIAFKATTSIADCKDDTILLNIEIKTPSGQTIHTAKGSQKVENPDDYEDPLRFTSYYTSTKGIPLTEYGKHTVSFSINGTLVGTMNYYVIEEGKK